MTVNNPQLDPTNKLRVTQPQSLIDTDFEYGTQVSKWENLSLTNNRPFAYPNTPITITNVVVDPSSTDKSLVTVSSTTTVAVNSIIVVTDTLLPAANGTFIVTASSAGTSFSYKMKTANATSNQAIYDANKTTVSTATLYTAAQIGADLSNTAFATDNATSSSLITVTTSVPHGLSIGNEIAVTASGATAGLTGGFVVAQVVSATQFKYRARVNVGSVGSFSDGRIYVRPQAQYLHRPADGGVIFTSNGQSSWQSAARQTRRYFRYQSGKGIQISSGTILKPNFQADSLRYVQATGLITVTTKDQHNLQTVPPDATVTIYGANEAGFNGTFQITSVTSANTFTVTPAAGLLTADTTASGNFYVSTSGWWGAKNRLGIFDQQNGLFFEFDGQQLYAVRRNSTYQLAGRVDVTNGSTTVSASTAVGGAFNGTLFSKQLTPGDFIVIKGQSYRVEGVTSDTSMVISPAYRGTTATALMVSKTVDTRVPQSQWNLDKMDGSGPSGYSLDLTKMQMFYIDFSWYGAGFIRWGLRGTDGDVTYVHKMQNNNANAEAYMRSGNLPGRYESATIPPVTLVSTDFASTDSVLKVADTSLFPSTGVLAIKQYTSATVAKVEHVYYSSKTATSFNIPILNGRAAAGGSSTTTTFGSGTTANRITVPVADMTKYQIGMRLSSAGTGSAVNVFNEATYITGLDATNGYIYTSQTPLITTANTAITATPMSASTPQSFTYSATQPIVVELAYPTLAPTISHWGTSVIMDGRFDDDKSLLFTYGQNAVTGLVPVGTLMPTSITVQTTTTANTSSINVSSNVGANSAPILVGMTVTGSGVPANTVVTGITGTGTATVITVSTLLVPTVASTTALTFTGATAKALMSVRVSPSVDNGTPGAFGSRELINRMQLVLRALDISLLGSGNLLVTLILNGTPSGSTSWTSIANPTSSLAQIADYGGGSTTVTNGEVTGGFFVNSTGQVELGLVRDLGNSVLGGGTSTSNNGIYPDGPDVATVYVTNVGATGVALAGRLSWTEAQA